MTRFVEILVLCAVLAGCAGPVCAAGNWNLSLPDTVTLDGALATLGDLAGGPVPANVQDLVIRAGLKPNGVVTVSRKDILRRLVTAGLAGGVRFSGAEECHLLYAGTRVTGDDLHRAVSRYLQRFVPKAHPGAPDSWFDLELPELELSAADDWSIESDQQGELAPGRNLVRINIVEQDRRESITATVILHRFGEVGRLRADARKDRALEEGMFDWEWRDLAELERGLAVGRGCIRGCSATRNLKAGRYLREPDLKPTPVVLAGDPVEMQVIRGQVAVSVRAFARQDGSLGQTIPVRNEMTGRLVNARVTGPGLVEWRK